MARLPISKLRAWCRWSVGVLQTVAALAAADPRPVVGPGASKDDVINAYGWPTGQSRLGNKEVLNYPQGSITLADGKVERVDFSPNVPWGPPRPRPAAPTATSAKRAEAPADVWLTDAAEALGQAQLQRRRVLALFTGSDWSPPSKKFQDEVATHPDFVNAFAGDFVFLKVDFPTRTALPPALKKQNEELRARCGVTTYPALIVLNPRGAPVGVVDLAADRAGDSYRARVIAAVAEVRDLLKQQPLPVETPKPEANATAPAAGGTATAKAEDRGERGLVAAVLSSAGWALALGLGGGAVIAALFVWWVWRSRVNLTGAANTPAKAAGPPVRLSDVPTLAELAAWPKERLRTLTAALFEAKGYAAQVRAGGAEAEIELRLRGHAKPSVLVCCVPGTAGPVGAKPVRELFGTLVSAGIEQGWIVAPGGFAPEARAEAAERGLELIDGDAFIDRLRQLDPATLAEVLGRAGG